MRPICQCTSLKHPTLRDVAAPFQQLRSKVEAMALKQLTKEKLDADPAIVEADGEFYNNPLGFAMEKFDFKKCFKCKQPFFAGLHDCDPAGGNAAANQQVDESKIQCMSCGNDGKFKCPKDHGAE